MNDVEMDRLLRLSQPTPVPAHALAAAGRDLLEEIMAESAGSDVTVHEIEAMRDRRRSGKLRWVVGLAAAVAVVLAIALPTLLFRGQDTGAPSAPVSPEPTAAAVDSGNPHVVIPDPEWKLAQLHESAEKSGYMTFKRKRGGASLSINWDPIDQYEQHQHDQPFGKQPTPTTFLGRDALLYASGTGYFEKLVKRDEVFVSFFARKVTRTEFDALADPLRELTAQQWLEQLPASVLSPEQSLALVQQYIADIPLPEGFDVATIAPAYPVQKTALRYQVVSKVTCGWLDVYQQALTTGDEPQMAEVERVLSGTGDWAVGKNLNSTTPQQVAFYLDLVAQREEIGKVYSPYCGD